MYTNGYTGHTRKHPTEDKPIFENPRLRELHEYYTDRKDHLFLREFFRDVKEGKAREYLSADKLGREELSREYWNTGPNGRGAKPKESAKGDIAGNYRECVKYISMLTKSSPRIKTLLALAGDLHVSQGQKMVIFYLNPFE